MYTIVASYLEPLGTPEEILINKQNTEIVWKQNMLTNTTNQQQIAVTPVTYKNYTTLLAKWGTHLCNYAHECSKSSKVFKGMMAAGGCVLQAGYITTNGV